MLAHNDHVESFQSQLESALKKTVLPTYVYGYPSKRSYRKFGPTIRLDKIWNNSFDTVNIYVHVPFCRHRCTYCTLFATTQHTPEIIDAYVDKICEQIIFYSTYAKNAKLTSIYFGGGTPTTLTAKQMEKVFKIIYQHFPKVSDSIETNVEGTPEDMTLPMLQSLKSLGVNRISVGIQSMQPAELKITSRNTSISAIETIQNIKSLFSNFNIDLICGLASQTRESWFESLNKVLEFHPSILSIFPVVLRTSAKMEKIRHKGSKYFLTDQEKFEIYDENVALLKKHNYKQDCYTRFSDHGIESFLQESLEFKGMPLIGIGPGGRSYKDQYHYSTDYVVSDHASLAVIKSYLDSKFDKDCLATNGLVLDQEEQRRRFVALNLTLNQLNLSEYDKKFGESCLITFGDEFETLKKNHCIHIDANNKVTLTDLGFKFSSFIAQLFFSDKMKKLEEEYQAT